MTDSYQHKHNNSVQLWLLREGRWSRGVGLICGQWTSRKSRAVSRNTVIAGKECNCHYWEWYCDRMATICSDQILKKHKSIINPFALQTLTNSAVQCVCCLSVKKNWRNLSTVRGDWTKLSNFYACAHKKGTNTFYMTLSKRHLFHILRNGPLDHFLFPSFPRHVVQWQ